MSRGCVALLAALLAAIPGQLTAQSAQDSVVAVVNEFFRAMTAHDTAATSRIQIADGAAYAIRADRDSLVSLSIASNGNYLRQLAAMRDTIIERMWQPTVRIHGPLATLWAPYDIHRNGKFLHCGIDAVTLVRTRTGWQIASFAYTLEANGCAPSPLGPLPGGVK